MLRVVFSLMCLAGAAHAEAPKVVTDIPPVHALVARVMQGVGTPDLVLGAGGSPHHHAMRPSEARMLAGADLVIWIGSGLTPWLQGPLDSLSDSARVLTLGDVEDAHLLEFREGAMFEAHDHDHGHESHDDHAGHDEHDGHDGDDHNDHAEKEEEHRIDPHLWLDPDNGVLFLNEISSALGEVDPGNAAIYAQNAAQGAAEILAAAQELEGQLAPVRGRSFVVLHDAFHYFEDHFEIEATGAISGGDAETPGAVRLSTLRAALQESGVHCAFTEPGVGTRLIDTATEGLDVQIATLDPLGSKLEPGPALYVDMLRAMGADIAACLDR